MALSPRFASWARVAAATQSKAIALHHVSDAFIDAPRTTFLSEIDEPAATGDCRNRCSHLPPCLKPASLLTNCLLLNGRVVICSASCLIRWFGHKRAHGFEVSFVPE